MNILAFAATNSRQSINKQLVTFAAQRIDFAQVEIIDLNDFSLPLFSIDVERDIGIPDAAQRFYDKITHADALIISFAEHNGSYTAAYKNLFDWAWGIQSKVFQQKLMLMLATSPGGRGGQTVLEQAVKQAPHFHGQVVGSLSISRFNEVFDRQSQTLTEPSYLTQLDSLLAELENAYQEKLLNR